MATITVKCTCKHDFQDKTYGNGIRVFNVSYNNKEAKCTVCDSKLTSIDFKTNPTFNQ